MKKLFLLGITVAMLAVSSCKKDCPTPAVVEPPVDLSASSWSGPCTINGINYTFTLALAADGTISGGFNVPSFTIASGSWNKTPNSNIVRIFFIQSGNAWKGQGTYNATTNKIEVGTLTQTSGGSFTGTFTVTKV